jgi:antirestriction protein ArdC
MDREIKVLMLWSEAITKGFAAPIWMTFKQALELSAHVKETQEGKPCSLCVQHRAQRD